MKNMVDQPFYKKALVRNFIRYVIEENPEVQLLKGTISNELKEDICSTSEEEIKTLIDETCEFIVGVKLPEEKKEKVIDVVKQICS
jgi:aspartate/glutamate racemase